MAAHLTFANVADFTAADISVRLSGHSVQGGTCTIGNVVLYADDLDEFVKAGEEMARQARYLIALRAQSAKAAW